MVDTYLNVWLFYYSEQDDTAYDIRVPTFDAYLSAGGGHPWSKATTRTGGLDSSAQGLRAIHCGNRCRSSGTILVANYVTICGEPLLEVLQ